MNEWLLLAIVAWFYFGSIAIGYYMGRISANLDHIEDLLNRRDQKERTDSHA